MNALYSIVPALGLLLLVVGALIARWASEPATAYVGIIGAGAGVLLLSIHALSSLLSG
jgi:hypothetical protein